MLSPARPSTFFSSKILGVGTGGLISDIDVQDRQDGSCQLSVFSHSHTHPFGTLRTGSGPSPVEGGGTG